MPWEELEQLIRPYYYEGKYGNKPYELELMPRIHLLQNLYDLSDQNDVALSDFRGSRISFAVNRSVRSVGGCGKREKERLFLQE